MYKFLLLIACFLHHTHDAESYVRPKRVIGGYFSTDGLFPYVVSIRINRFGPWVHFCGGAIISNRYIISSAHCVILQEESARRCYKSKYVNLEHMKFDLAAVAGTNRLSSQNGHYYQIESYIYHSEFNFKHGINDVSLLKTAKQIVFNSKVLPIALSKKQIHVGALVIVPGWGLTSYPGEQSDILKYVNLKVISYEQCAKSWRKIYKSQLCTYSPVGEGVCTSDSGGPLVHDKELVGLVSFGKPCAVGTPDVFTNVSHLYHWVIYNMNCLEETEFLSNLL